MKLVLIEWMDSHSTGDKAWQRIDEVRESCRPMINSSVGWLVSETNGQKQLVSSLMGFNKTFCGGDIVIPNKCVVKMTVLRK